MHLTIEDQPFVVVAVVLFCLGFMRVLERLYRNQIILFVLEMGFECVLSETNIKCIYTQFSLVNRSLSFGLIIFEIIGRCPDTGVRAVIIIIIILKNTETETKTKYKNAMR